MALDKRQDPQNSTDETQAVLLRNVSPAAARALAEAEARRQAQTQVQIDTQRAKEIGGREGPDPIRYGDWEVKGIASDF